MDAQTLAMVERRLARAERRTLWLAIIVILSSVGIVLSLGRANTINLPRTDHGGSIRADSLVVRDLRVESRDGVTHAHLSASDGMCSLDLTGRGGELSLESGHDGTEIVLGSSESPRRVIISADEDTEQIVLGSPERSPRVWLLTNRNGAAILDKSSEKSAGLSVKF